LHLINCYFNNINYDLSLRELSKAVVCCV